ncbi:MAG: hypothetical protein QNJ54_22465 [Prochloraceae cyanobacterium]|nr:hypothetical protein [Prochloraceae cyanobacterium]
MILARYQPSDLYVPSVKDERQGISYSYTLGRIFIPVGQTVWLLLLLLLLVVSLFVWLLIASFRSGWRFYDWAVNPELTIQTRPLYLVYGLIVILVSPLALLLNWLQKKLHRWWGISFPPQVDVRQIIQAQLGIELDNKFPFLCEPKTSTSNNQSGVVSQTSVEKVK